MQKLLVSSKKMNTIIKLALRASLAASLLLAGTAFAANFSNVQFDNGDVTVSGQGGSTVNATFHVVVPANQVVENIQTDVLGDNLAPVCTSVGGDLGLQEGTHDVTVPVMLPPNTGTYTLSVQGSGIYGGIRSIDCNDNVVGTASFSGALRTVASESNPTTSGGTSQNSMLAAIWAWIQAQTKPVTPAPAPVPAVPAVCTSYAQAAAGAMQGVTNQANVRLQGFLLSQNESIPALAAGASFGFYGPQTAAAVAHFKGVSNCQ